MKKSILATTCVLMLAGVASAATTQVISELNSGNPGPGTTWFAPPSIWSDADMAASPHLYWRFTDEDWGWTHDFGTARDNQLAAIANIDLSTVAIDSATLDIDAWDVDTILGEVDNITADGTGLGSLVGNDEDWVVTPFNLAAILTDLNDGVLNVAMDIDVTNAGAAVGLRSSLLTVTYSYEELPPAVIPAPGAVLLGGFGAGLVGWMRRRRSL